MCVQLHNRQDVVSGANVVPSVVSRYVLRASKAHCVLSKVLQDWMSVGK